LLDLRKAQGLTKTGQEARSVMARWECRDKHCPNFTKTCALVNDTHFKLLPTQIGKWAELIHTGEASVDQLPLQLKPIPLNRGTSKSVKTPDEAVHTVNYNTYYYGGPGPTVQSQLSGCGYQNYANFQIPSSPVPFHNDPKDDITEYVAWLSSFCKGQAAELQAAGQKLKEQVVSLATVRNMGDEKWERLKIPLGVGWTLTEKVKDFLRWKKEQVVELE
jgi:hypothetical protein